MALGALGEAETLASGAPERAPRRWPWWVAAALALVLAVGWIVDRHVASTEQDELLGAARAGGTAVAAADAEIVGMVRYASPLLVSTRVSPKVRDDLRALVRQAAASGAAGVREARDAVVAVPLVPWHREAVAARDAYAAYLDDRLARLEVVAASYPQGLAGDGGAALGAARDALRMAYGDAGAAAVPAEPGAPIAP